MPLIAVFTVIFLFLPREAWAYIDPGYGNYLAGSVVAAVMGFFSFVSAFVVYFFRKLLPGVFRNLWQKHRVTFVSCLIILVSLITHVFTHPWNHGFRGNAPVVRGSVKFDPNLTGAYIHDPSRVSPGYNLYEGKLIDMHGRIVKKWSSIFLGTLDKNGDYYAQRYFQAPSWGRYTWDDRVIWEKNFPVHHQILLTPQETVITLTKEMHEYKGRRVEFDVILEFDKGGRELRRFSTWDHFQELYRYHGPLNADRSIEAHRPDDFKQSPWGGNFDYYHMNFVSVIPDNLLKNVNPAFEPGNWVISFRHGDMIFIVNPNTGRVVWHIFSKDVPGEIQGVHATQMLPSGNMIILDNGTYRRWSRIIELNLMTNKVVWEYNAHGFFSYTQSHIQVLENGNMLVTESEKGHVFEVTRDKKIVWEFYNPLRQNTWVSKATLADCGLDADRIFSMLIARGWLRPVSYSEASLTRPVRTFRRQLKDFFPEDFQAVNYVLTTYEHGKNHEFRDEINRMRRYPAAMVDPLFNK
jgi:hypothetical protein